MNIQHVVPRGDLVEHDTSSYQPESECVCGPSIGFVPGGAIIVHHSLDGRERAESVGTTSEETE